MDLPCLAGTLLRYENVQHVLQEDKARSLPRTRRQLKAGARRREQLEVSSPRVASAAHTSRPFLIALDCV